MTAKEYLWQVRDIRESIRSDRCELQMIEELTENAYGSVLEIVDTLKAKLNSEIAEYCRLEEDIRNKILNLPNNKYKTLLKEYYLNCLTLEEVAVIMNRDFDYIRHLHGWALEYFKKFYDFEKKL